MSRYKRSDSDDEDYHWITLKLLEADSNFSQHHRPPDTIAAPSSDLASSTTLSSSGKVLPFFIKLFSIWLGICLVLLIVLPSFSASTFRYRLSVLCDTHSSDIDKLLCQAWIRGLPSTDTEERQQQQLRIINSYASHNILAVANERPAFLKHASTYLQRIYERYITKHTDQTFLPFSPIYSLPSSDQSNQLNEGQEMINMHEALSVFSSFGPTLLETVYGQPMILMAPVKQILNDTHSYSYRYIIDKTEPNSYAALEVKPVCDQNLDAAGRLHLLHENELRNAMTSSKLSNTDLPLLAQSLDYWIQQYHAKDDHPSFNSSSRRFKHKGYTMNEDDSLSSYAYALDEPWYISINVDASTANPLSIQHGPLQIDDIHHPWLYYQFSSCLHFARQLRPTRFQLHNQERNSITIVRNSASYAHTYWSTTSKPSFMRQAILSLQSFLITQDLQSMHLIIWIDQPYINTNPNLRPTGACVEPDIQDSNQNVWHLPCELHSLLSSPLFNGSFSIRYFNAEKELLSTPLAASSEYYASASDDLFYSQSDLLRLVVMYNYGGVYFDADVLLLRDLSMLLHQEWMYKWGSDCHGINAAISHFYKHSPALHRLLVRLSHTPHVNPFDWGNRLYTHVYQEMVAENSEHLFTVFPACFFDPPWASGLTAWMGEEEGEITPSQWNGPFAFHLHGEIWTAKIHPASDYARVINIIQKRVNVTLEKERVVGT